MPEEKINEDDIEIPDEWMTAEEFVNNYIRLNAEKKKAEDNQEKEAAVSAAANFINFTGF